MRRGVSTLKDTSEDGYSGGWLVVGGYLVGVFFFAFSNGISEIR